MLDLKRNISSFINLTRLNSPVGIYLLYIPCLAGSALVYTSYNELIYYSLLFFIGSILMRSSGCIINDIFDRKFDAKVARTKTRPLASGELSVNSALGILFLFLLLSLILLLNLNTYAIMIGISSFFLIILYPLMKRITYWPQFFLGITFNVGAFLAPAAITSSIEVENILLYVGLIFWTLAYDTIYAFADIKDDLIAGIKSSAIAISNMNYKFIISIFCLFFCLFTFIACIAARAKVSVILPFIAISYCLMLLQISNLNIEDSRKVIKLFKSISYIGFIICIGIIASRSYLVM